MGAAETLRAAKERRQVLNQRIREAKELAQTTRDGAERRRQLERARILHDMYVECNEEIARLEGRKLAEKKQMLRGDGVFAGGLVWADLAGMTWGSADGLTWADIQQARDGAQTGRQLQLLTDLLNDGLDSCTPRQQAYIHAYYTDEMVLEEIAEDHGVNKSAVCRGIKRGLARVGHHVVARLCIAQCLDNGTFDYLKFAQQTQALTERQTELLYLAMTQDASYQMMADYLGRDKSTVFRGVERAEARLRTLRVDFLPEANPTRVKFGDWAGISEKKLAEQLGLSRRFYYQAVHRGERVHGVPLLHYHILCRIRRGWSARDTANELGVSEGLCKRISKLYPESVPLDPALLPDYRPKQVERTPAPGTVLAALRDLTRGADAIIDRLDAATLSALREAVSC